MKTMDTFKTLPILPEKMDIGGRLRKTLSSVTPKTAATRKGTWTPPALHPITLIVAILVPLALLTILQLLLQRSQRDNGIIFAPDINALPLSRTFLYQYLPTVVAVVFSIFWAWIDLEVKRLEPYYRLSREDGALGKDSLLLCYPFDFVPLVPIRALRQRHWPVFWASLALVLVTWGLVPTQAGIFSIRHISRSFPTTFNVSTSFIPADQQPTTLKLRFAQSAYGIAALNETLPPYMTHDYMLAPFTPSFAIGVKGGGGDVGDWIAPTTMYGLELRCEPAITIPTKGWPTYNSSTGCRMSVGLSGNITQAEKGTASQQIKAFSAMYAGYWPTAFASFHIDECPPERNHTFYAAYTRNKKRDEDPPNNVTAIFCEPFYYEQDVLATVTSHTKRPTDVVALGSKRQLPDTKFNAKWLEMMMNGGRSAIEVRGDALPELSVPSWVEQLADTEMSLVDDTQPMVGMAVVVGRRSLQDYLDWTVLSNSYEKAWRLLFARVMADILDTDFATQKQAAGNRTVLTDAIIVEPAFTYIVEGLLGVVSIVAMVLLYISVSRTATLRSNPSTIASIMSLVSENSALLTDFESLDGCTLEELQEAVCQERYRLVADSTRTFISKLSLPMADRGEVQTIRQTTSQRLSYKPVRPIEFSTWIFVPLVGLFAILSISLGLLFRKNNPDGLPLPSSNKIVQNLLENYIPTAIATLIEPIWVLINRLLCLLQPIEGLQACNTKAKKSIDLNYSSLPPQLVILKAIRAGHLVLASVCGMALLANVLAVAFAGLFYHGTVQIRQPTTFQPPFETKFVTLNGSVGPVGSRYTGTGIVSGAYRGGRGRDQFLVAESNYTQGTPLPAWTGEKYFYFPFTTVQTGEDESQDSYEAATTVLGAELDCANIKDNAHFRASLTEGFNITMTKGSVKVECVNAQVLRIKPGPETSSPGEYVCQKGPSALEIAFLLEAKSANATLAEKKICWEAIVLGWVRDSEGSCNSTRKIGLNSNNSFFVQCVPRLVKGHGNVRVDVKGRLLKEVLAFENNLDNEEAKTIFNNATEDFIGQSNRYLFQSVIPTWHNDSFTSEFINYFASHAVNSTLDSRLLDPKRSLPTLEEVQVPLGKAYSRLFAIWLGLNKEQLLVRRANAGMVSSPGWRVVREERLFLSTPLFAIAEGILAMYTVVAIMVYLRRPGEYLPRLPTSIASVIGLFAAGGAVRDMRGTSHFGSKERAHHLEKLDARYGYGNYVGVDGMVHIGIEKTPFVRLRSSTQSGRGC